MNLVEWLNQQDMELCRWEYVDGPEPGDVLGMRGDHHHELVPLEPEAAEVILESYLVEREKIKEVQ